MNIQTTKLLHRQAGLSLVELMIAITISMLLLAGVGTIFVNNKQTYRVQEAVSRLQENGRFAIGLLTKDIRMADFWGCGGSTSNITDHIVQEDPAAPVDKPITLGDGGISGTDDDGLNGSDSITLQGAYGSGITISGHNVTSASFSMNTVDHEFEDNDIVLSSDCNKGDLFVITSANSGSTVTVVGNTGATGAGLKNGSKPGLEYPEGQILRVVSYTYSIKAGASGEPALFRSENGTDQELIEGVQDMQIKYGEDTDGDGTANIYRDADIVAVMDNVVSVRFTLTVRTLDDNIALTTDATYGGKRLYRDFTSTITIRNRVS